MSQTSPLLGLPYIEAAQAQKHVTHNEALRMLDAIVQLAVLDRDLATPPATPQEGDRYIVAAGASGVWAGREGQVAAWQDGAWAFFAPATGWLAWVADEDVLLAYVSGGWTAAGSGSGGGGGGSESMPRFGVNTIADAINRLAVKSDAVLLRHDDVTPGSGDMRAIMDKADVANTASLLFQSDASGRAEIGLTGDDKLHVKVSADGTAWTEAMVVDHVTGHAGFGTDAPEAQLHIAGTTQPQLMIDMVSGDPDGALLVTKKARGTPGALSAAQSGDVAAEIIGSAFDGSDYITCASHQIYISNTASAGVVPAHHRFYTMSGSGVYSNRITINAVSIIPGVVNAMTCGANGSRWSAVWAANGTISTSDARDKNVIAGLDFAGTMVDAVDPVLFRWKVGGNEVCKSATETTTDNAGNQVPAIEIVPKPGVRVHAGFLAQDIKAAMDAQGVDFGAWGLENKDDPDSRQFMRPDQLIAVLWAALKETRAEVKRLTDIPEP